MDETANTTAAVTWRMGEIPWKAWIESMRPRMLTVGLATGIVPGAVAAHFGSFSWMIMVLETLLATVLLVVSCWADEIGDLQHGVDNENRLGPHRPLQRGAITIGAMSRAALIGAAFAASIGLILLGVSFGLNSGTFQQILLFVLLGMVAIVAAFTYTLGKRPYGYHGFGDAVAYIFFGVVAGLGGFYLYGHTWQWTVLLPASGVGLHLVSTINLQNIRDFENDTACGKRTTAVILGYRCAVIYQFVLIFATMGMFLAFPLATGVKNPTEYMFVVGFVPLFRHLHEFGKLCRDHRRARDLDTLMWPLTRAIGVVSVLFAVGIMMNAR